VADANRHVQWLLFAVQCQNIRLIPPRKKWLLSAGFECANGWCIMSKWRAFSRIAPPHQQNEFALTFNACWLYGMMCVTPANIVEEHLQHLAGFIDP
jgi:hypothetical protein